MTLSGVYRHGTRRYDFHRQELTSIPGSSLVVAVNAPLLKRKELPGAPSSPEPQRAPERPLEPVS